MDESTDGLKDLKDIWTDGWIDGWMDLWTYGLIDRWKNIKMDR